MRCEFARKIRSVADVVPLNPKGALDFLSSIGGKPVAACLLGPTRDGSREELLVILEDGARIERQGERIGGQPTIVTKVSRRLWERDVKKGSLGEFVAGCMLLPYTPLVGAEYLRAQEVELKSRVITEELENLALRYGELLLEMRIDPWFFFHAKMQRRARIYPPMRSQYLNLLREDSTFDFSEALDRLSQEGLVEHDEHHVRVTRKMMERLPKLGDYSLNPFREVELAVRRLATYGVATDLMTIPLTDDIGRDLEAVSAGGFEELPDPKSFLHLPAGDSLVSLDDARGYHELLPDGRHAAPRTIRRIGGALNFVYLIEYGSEGRRRKVVAKSYQNWYGLKWIPVSIWAIGAQNFDILGERRLTNEYRMNRKLKEGGLSTPEILHVSIPRRTIIEEYVPGRGFDRVAREYVGGGFPNHREAIEDLGEEFARIHQLGITLGDPKPDNAILGNDGRIWFVDLEQASEGGSATWDLAEFLYYSGHYSLRWSKVKPLAEAFIEGYLRNGERKAVGSVANSRYKRIFGVITAPHIVMEMAKLCRSYGASS